MTQDPMEKFYMCPIKTIYKFEALHIYGTAMNHSVPMADLKKVIQENMCKCFPQRRLCQQKLINVMTFIEKHDLLMTKENRSQKIGTYFNDYDYTLSEDDRLEAMGYPWPKGETPCS